MAMRRSWPSNSQREKPLSFLAEDRHQGPQFRALQEVWMQNPSGAHLVFGFYSWKNHWHFQSPIIKWKSAYLRTNYSNDWLNSWLGDCSLATRTQRCAHTNSSGTVWLLPTACFLAVSFCDMKEELQNTAYVFPRWKEAENLKRKFHANSFFPKVGSELEYQADRYNCHHFGMQDGAFWLRDFFFLQWTQLLSHEELINKQRIICAS